MEVSQNSGTPISFNSVGFSLIKHPFWGSPHLWNPHIYHKPWNLPGHSQGPRGEWKLRAFMGPAAGIQQLQLKPIYDHFFLWLQSFFVS